MTYRLAIDYGTSYSGAAVADPTTGVARPVFINGRPTIPSIVVLDERSGELLTGDPAENAAAIWPGNVIRAPKRYLGQAEPLFREPRVLAEEAVAATIRVLVAEARQLYDREPPTEVRLTHPARWAARRRDGLRRAANLAGIDEPQLLPEPVAAAIRFAAGERIAIGEFVAVYDLGAGTFDTAVLERTGDGFALHGEPGGLELGGDSFDERLYGHLGQQLEAADWEAIRNSPERVWRRAQTDFRRWVRLAKEALSSNPRGVDIQYPGPSDHDPIWMTGEELHELLRPDLTKTVDELERTIANAGLSPDRIGAVYLAGGSSKIPLVETLIVDRFGKSARLEDDRKQVVALGAAVAPTSAIAEHDAAVIVDGVAHPGPTSDETAAAGEPAATAAAPSEPPAPAAPAPPPPPATTVPPEVLTSTVPPEVLTSTVPPAAPPAGPAWVPLPPPRPPTDPSASKSRLPLIGGGIAAAVVLGLAAIALAQGGFGGTSTTFPPVAQNETDAPLPPVVTDEPVISEPPVIEPPTTPPETPPPGWSDAELSLWQSYYGINEDDCDTDPDPMGLAGDKALAAVSCHPPDGIITVIWYFAYETIEAADGYFALQVQPIIEDTSWGGPAADGTAIGGRQVAYEWADGTFSLVWSHDENPFVVEAIANGGGPLGEVADQVRFSEYDPTP